VLEPGLKRANLRAILGLRCLAGAAADIGHVRRIGELNGDELLGVEVTLVSEAEAVGELCCDLERILAGGMSTIRGRASDSGPRREAQATTPATATPIG
jgi:hypothetical protein